MTARCTQKRLPPLWSAVSVEATSTALADALVFLTGDQIATLRHPDLIRATFIDTVGNLRGV